MPDEMIEVTMTVEFKVKVPKGTDIGSLCLEIDTDDIEIVTTDGFRPRDAEIDGYETVAVEETEKVDDKESRRRDEKNGLYGQHEDVAN